MIVGKATRGRPNEITGLSIEDKLLVSTRITTSTNSVVGNDQQDKKFWENITKYYNDNCKSAPPRERGGWSCVGADSFQKLISSTNTISESMGKSTVDGPMTKKWVPLMNYICRYTRNFFNTSMCGILSKMIQSKIVEHLLNNLPRRQIHLKLVSTTRHRTWRRVPTIMTTIMKFVLSVKRRQNERRQPKEKEK